MSEFDANLPDEQKEAPSDSPDAVQANRGEASDDQPIPSEEDYKAAGEHAMDVRLAWEGLPLSTAKEMGLGPARGIRARMLMGLPAYNPGISEEEYVRREVAETKRQMDAGLLGDHDGLRLERSKLYAQTRYRGFMLGEIGSL